MNIKETLQLLDIQEVTTKRQKNNGTREFELPIKDAWTNRKKRSGNDSNRSIFNGILIKLWDLEMGGTNATKRSK